MSISIDVGKEFDTMQHPFIITIKNNLNRLGKEHFCKLLKGILKDISANIILNCERQFSPKIESKMKIL